ncbi:hypothetical protein HDU97_004242 [Phlyctochytrium planicorne]|nr:hypothetical protein HDU97_004242 [Phlyctochytrium planicorne]
MHTQGRQGSHYKVELREARTGSKLTERVHANAVLEDVFMCSAIELKEKPHQFLYEDNGELHLLDRDTMEESVVPLDALEADRSLLPLLNDTLDIKVLFHASNPISVRLPPHAVYKVTYTDPPASTVTNEGKGTGFKNAVLENDFNVTVPEFVRAGDEVVVELVNGKYRERVLNKKK